MKNAFIHKSLIPASSLKTFMMSVALVCSVGNTAWAQDRISTPQKLVTILGINSATVAPNGLVFGQVATGVKLAGDDAQSGTTFALGIGLGDASDGGGFQLTASGGGATDTFDSYGYFGVKAALRLSDSSAPTYVALSFDQLGGFGAAAGLKPSTSVVLTRFSSFTGGSGGNYPIMMTIGAGTHVRDSATKPGVFAGAGIGLSENFGVSAAWNGDYIEAGTTFRIRNLDNAIFSTSVSDALNQDNRQQISFGFTWFYDAVKGR